MAGYCVTSVGQRKSRVPERGNISNFDTFSLKKKLCFIFQANLRSGVFFFRGKGRGRETEEILKVIREMGSDRRFKISGRYPLTRPRGNGNDAYFREKLSFGFLESTRCRSTGISGFLWTIFCLVISSTSGIKCLLLKRICPV